MKFNSIRHRLRSLPSFNRSKISKANRNGSSSFRVELDSENPS